MKESMKISENMATKAIKTRMSYLFFDLLVLAENKLKIT
jgi:hypothetical protein